MNNKLKEIVTASRWTHPIFDGKIILEGRILSPSESEAAGLATSLLATQMAPPEQIAKFEEIKQKAESEDADYSELLQWAKMVNPDGLLKMAQANDKVICSCVRKCSMDDGKTWEPIKIVMNESEQNADKNQLWVGLLMDADRTDVLNKCLEGHRRAAERIAGFLQ
tara:strand:+ start:2724 stop:3221 length:498 start_codon:yes stop_codon:yes gene_type:complete